MLSAHAYTLRQKARLAVSLAWVGGFVDAVGFLLLLQVFTSNMTGNTATLGRWIAEARPDMIAYAAFPILIFFLGAALSGVLTIGGRRLGIRSFYALALSVEVVLLSAFMSIASFAPPPASGERAPLLLIALAALAMGLQNATITQIAGAVVRTTHVTGVLTDLGLESVQLAYWFRDRTRGRLRQRIRRALRISPRHPSLQRLLLLSSIWGSFLIGAVLGVLGLRYFGVTCLAGPIAFLAALVTLDLIRPIATFTPVAHSHGRHDPELRRYGIDPEMLPSEVGLYRIGGDSRAKQRSPDLGRLVEHAATEHRLILLLLGDNVEVTDNDLRGLEQAIRSLRERHSDLVLCVTESKRFLHLRASRLAEELGQANLCSDPEFALARAIELVESRSATY